jgi:hypothetical protein
MSFWRAATLMHSKPGSCTFARLRMMKEIIAKTALGLWYIGVLEESFGATILSAPKMDQHG